MELYIIDTALKVSRSCTVSLLLYLMVLKIISPGCGVQASPMLILLCRPCWLYISPICITHSSPRGYGHRLKTLHSDKSKGKSSRRSQQAVDELDYLVTFNNSITQAMARTIQDLSVGNFINVTNLTLARCYLDYIRAGEVLCSCMEVD